MLLQLLKACLESLFRCGNCINREQEATEGFEIGRYPISRINQLCIVQRLAKFQAF